MQQNLAIPSTVKPATPKAKEEPPPPSRDFLMSIYPYRRDIYAQQRMNVRVTQ